MMEAARRQKAPAERPAAGRTILKTKETHTANKSQNINEVIQSSIITLENECSSLKEKRKIKQKELAELETNCSKQSSNLVKLHSEAEQIKVKLHIEIQHFNSVLAKVKESRDVCVLLQQYFTNKIKGVNELLKSKDCLEVFLQDKKENADKRMLLIEQFYSKFDTTIYELKTIVEKMNSSKNKSRDECEKMMNEIKKHTELQQKDIMELEQRLTSVNGDKRGLAAVNKFLQNQKNEITATEEKLKLEADRIYQSTKNELENMQTIVAENNIRVSNVKKELEDTEKQISDLNELTLQLNNSNELMNNSLKELIEEENCLNMKHQSNLDIATEKEKEIDKLQKMLDEKLQLNKINNELEEEQQSLRQLDVSMDNEITELETKKETVLKHTCGVKQEILLLINEETLLAEEINNLNSQIQSINHKEDIILNQSSENEQETNMMCENLKTEYNKLVSDEEELTRNSINKRKEIVVEEKLVADLKNELQNLKTKLKEQIRKVADTEKEIVIYNDEFEMKLFEIALWKKKTKTDLIEAKVDLDKKLQFESEIEQMKEDMAAQEVGFNRILQDLTDNYAKKIQVQDELMLQLKTSCESELHEREERNVQTRCELKDLMARVTQVHQDIESTIGQITAHKLAQNQCEKLINHLEEKLKKISTVATSTRAMPQQKQVIYGSTRDHDYLDKMQDSPGSDSSGLTFNYDENVVSNKPVVAPRFYQAKRGPLQESNFGKKKTKLINRPSEMKISSVKHKLPQGKYKESGLDKAKDDTWFALFD